MCIVGGVSTLVCGLHMPSEAYSLRTIRYVKYVPVYAECFPICLKT